MQFKDKIRYCRKTFGLTQQELANSIHVSQRLIKYYESGEREPSKIRIGEFSRLFQVPLRYFLLDSEEEPGEAFYEESYRYEVNRYKKSDLVRETAKHILAAGGYRINTADPFWDVVLESVAKVIMSSS